MFKNLASFEIFLQRKNFSSPLEESLKKEISEWYSVNESSILNSIKNKLSKSIFGDFSRVGVIDNIRKGNLQIKKDVIENNYKINDEVDELRMKRDEVLKIGNKSAVESIESQITKKKEELNSYSKLAKSKIQKGIDLLEKTIDKNKRRKDYYEAGFKEDEYNLAEFEYELSKKRSLDSSEIKKIKDRVDKAKKEAAEIIKIWTAKNTPIKPNKTP